MVNLRKQIALFIIFVMSASLVTGCGKDENDMTETISSENGMEIETETGNRKNVTVNGKNSNIQENIGIEFPYKLKNDELEIEFLFQYSGINPDCNDEEGENIGAIQLKNSSGQYLKSAELTVIMEDGEKLSFLIEDIPAESTVMAFEIENSEYDEQQTVTEIVAEVEYSEETFMREGTVEVLTDEIGISLRNQSAEKIQNMTVIYHCDMDDIYFGGKSYQKEIEMLGAGESTTVSAEECYFGQAAVVDIMY